jgi:CheY-like chemotaxis protein
MFSVLVVEDDRQLLSLLAEFIRACGYDVLEANTADEAIGLLTSGAARADIIFSDILLPGTINGFGLAKWVRRNHPAARILLTSGYTNGEPSDAAQLHDGPLLHKPYHLKELETALQHLSHLSREAETR